MSDLLKNLFDFGTGSIDRDQWLRDIDREQEDFILKYRNSDNKWYNKRAAVVREDNIRKAFADLRTRIANGDMLNRDASGMYNFGSVIDKGDDKQKAAYEYALGFMRKLGLRLLDTAIPEPEAPKQTYSALTLNDDWIKYNNPSGKFFASIWNKKDDAGKKAALTAFLKAELGKLDKYNAFDNYDNKDDIINRINAFINDPTSDNLSKVGFNLDYLNPLTKDGTEEEAPKTEKEKLQLEIADYQEEEQLKQARKSLDYAKNRGTENYSFKAVPQYDFNLEVLNYINSFKAPANAFTAPGGESLNLDPTNFDKYVNSLQAYLDSYFKNFSNTWKSIYDRDDASKRAMAVALNKLFAQYTNKENKPTYAFDWSKYFTQIGDNMFMMNNSLDIDKGRYTYYSPTSGIHETSIIDTPNEYVARKMQYQIPSSKNGGVLSFAGGGQATYEDWIGSELAPQQTTSEVTPKAPKTVNTKSDNSPLTSNDLDAGDLATIIGTTIADIGSMLSANALGWGTVTSAGLGVASTVGNSINTFRHGDFWGGLTNLGLGLGADAVGLIPGVGAGAKAVKIGKTLTRFARPLMAAFAANNYKEAGMVLNKGIKSGFGSLSAEDWALLATTLTSMVSRGKSAHTRQKNTELMHSAMMHSSPKDKNGNITKYVINREGLLKAREETLKNKVLGINTSSNKYVDKQLNSIPLNGEVEAGWNLKPVDWKTFLPDLNIGKKNKLEHLKNLKNKTAPQKPEPVKDDNGIWKKNENGLWVKAKRDGGKLYALRHGGIIKAQDGKKVINDEAEYFKTQFGLGQYDKAQIDNPYPQSQVLDYVINTVNDNETRAREAAANAAGLAKWNETAPGQFNFVNPVTPRETVTIPEGGGPVDPNRQGKSLAETNYRHFINFGEESPTFMDYDYSVAHGGADKRSDKLKATQGKYDQPHAGRLNYKSALDALLNYYNLNGGKNIMGDVLNYYNIWLKTNPQGTYSLFIEDYNKNVDTLRSQHKEKFRKGANGLLEKTVNEIGWTPFNDLHHKMYGSYGQYTDNTGAVRDDWDADYQDILGESTWRRLPNAFDNDDDMKALRQGYLKNGDAESYVFMDKNGHLVPMKAPAKPAEESKENKSKKTVDSLTDKDLWDAVDKLNEPTDPTIPLIATKLGLGLSGNAKIYGKLEEEMPAAAMLDPIDRHLAIVGNLRIIDEARNKLGDLRKINIQTHGSDMQVNFAKDLETERIGREIFDNAFRQDALRQFDTAQKSWNLDNEDILMNQKIHAENDKNLKARQEMIARIRAARRSGDQNLMMGALADFSNWRLKKYLTEKDLVDQTNALKLGDLSSYTSKKLITDPTYNKLVQAYSNATDKNTRELLDRKIKLYQMLKEEEERGEWADKRYSLLHTPLFVKKGDKLEVEKLKQRGKDNDRFVKTFIELRKTNRRRRR